MNTLRPGAKYLILLSRGTAYDVAQGKIPSGNHYQWLNNMLIHAGISILDCSICTVVPLRLDATKSLKELKLTDARNRPTEIAMPYIQTARKIIYQQRPQTIIAFGDLAYYAAYEGLSVAKYRGSMHQGKLGTYTFFLIPTYDSVQCLTTWYNRRFLVQKDLARARRGYIPEPNYEFQIYPTYREALDTLQWLANATVASEKFHISCDVETTQGYLSCIGFGTSATNAICIPFCDVRDQTNPTKPYWTSEQHYTILRLCHKIFKKHTVVGQNFIYDMQWIRDKMFAWPKKIADTMLMQHVLLPGTEKSLDVLASIYLDHYVYWKDDLKDWKSWPKDPELFWNYNCKDCVTTWELRDLIEAELLQENLHQQYLDLLSYQQEYFITLTRGIRLDHSERKRQLIWFLQQEEQRVNWLEHVISPLVKGETKGAPWYASPQKLQNLLYKQLGLKKQYSVKGKKRQLTTEEEALQHLQELYPILTPLLRNLMELKTIRQVKRNIFKPSFVSPDNRFHCQFNTGGPETFRLSSNATALGFGCNIQNITSGVKM